jgi:hypothetical protein
MGYAIGKLLATVTQLAGVSNPVAASALRDLFVVRGVKRGMLASVFRAGPRALDHLSKKGCPFTVSGELRVRVWFSGLAGVARGCQQELG